ncbi:MAG TPA: hypothetical protein DCY40_04565 [Actinobacteria bacterium]|nr:hypothetical protein [Actinomycetota bacterium]
MLRMARDRADMTQGELAARAGVTQQAISAYETGRREPTLPTLLRLIEATGLELRMQLHPRDRHDDALAAYLASLPPADRAALERKARAQAEAARLRRVRGA